MARLMGVGDVLVQNDLAYELYDRPAPQQFVAVAAPAAGRSAASPSATGTRARTCRSTRWSTSPRLAAAPDLPWPSPLEVLSVAKPRALVRAESTQGALVVAGDAVGLDDRGRARSARHRRPLSLYAGTLDAHPLAAASVLTGGATLVVTDSNRKQPFLWNVVSDNAGVTLASSDPKPNVALDIFPERPRRTPSRRAQITGVASVTGNPRRPRTTRPTWPSTGYRARRGRPTSPPRRRWASGGRSP